MGRDQGVARGQVDPGPGVIGESVSFKETENVVRLIAAGLYMQGVQVPSSYLFCARGRSWCVFLVRFAFFPLSSGADVFSFSFFAR